VLKISYDKNVLKDLDRIPVKDVERIVSIINGLPVEPFPAKCKKLSTKDKVYRIRQGNYRVIYTVNQAQQEIRIILVGHRKEIYRELK
jgi:mRNA interferase RelE/StbE